MDLKVYIQLTVLCVVNVMFFCTGIISEWRRNKGIEDLEKPYFPMLKLAYVV
jgi:hypothetical protein